jgi:3-hydroxybutyryl-CoA dehydrogenase
MDGVAEKANHMLWKRVAVIGAGLMGHGIAQVCAMHGCEVRLYDVDQKVLESARSRILVNLQLFAEAGLIDASSIDEVCSRVKATLNLEEAVAVAQFVVEAAPENMDLKTEIFKRMGKAAPMEAILASNTSTLSITEMAKYVENKARTIITHWFNPPYLVPVVEVVKGQATSDETVQKTIDFLKAIGKEPVMVLKEVPGFLVNRIQTAMFREVLALLEAGVAEPEEIDRAVRGSFGMRLPIIGPLKTVDLAGLDLMYKGMGYLYPFLDASKELQKVLRDKVDAGHLGKKTGKGFFEYETGPGRGLEEQERDRKMIQLLKMLYGKEKGEGEK